jgi:hypothetical protein
MRHSFGLTFIALSLSACALDAVPEGDVEELGASQGELVGGHVASEAEYPATVYLGGCTGVKVGPRHFLSAAHCFGPPNEATLKVTPQNDAQNIQHLTIESVTLHPQWTHCSACAGDGSMSDFGYRPDAALIIVQELTPAIPVAVIDPTPVQVGDSVTLTGYGFKVGETLAQDPLSLDSQALSIPGGYVATWGPAIQQGNPGLCPGDSGGPLYRTGTNQVVGINALVSSWPDTGLPHGNWFTRLDSDSRYDVWAWLDGLLDSAPPTTPCGGICSSPEPFTAQLNLGNLGVGERCFESTTSTLSAGTCGGFASGRTFSVNGVALPCGQSWVAPPKRNGGYCVKVGAGESAWAWLSTW